MEEKEYTYLLAFMKIAKAISSSLDLKEVLNLIVKNTCETTGSKGSALMLLEEKGQRLEVKVSFGLSDQYVEKGPLSADKSISDTLMGQPIIIEDAASDPRVQYPQEAKKEGVASIISIPIRLRDRVIGVMRLYTSVTCKFTQDDIQFLIAVAEQGGIAIENARVHEDVKMNYEKAMTSLSSAVK